MSWTASFAIVRGTAAVEDMADEKAKELNPAMASWDPYCIEQFESARKVAVALIASGTIESPERIYRVQLFGHSNPNHAPKKGWGNDSVDISIAQKGTG